MNSESANNLEDRPIDLAVRVLALVNQLPQTFAGRHLAQQLLRAGTAPAPNYGEARGAESRADFIHKRGIAPKELNETQVWLKILARAKLATAGTTETVTDECRQRCRMINASIQTACRNSMNSDK